MQDLKKKMIEHLKKRLYESALNNVGVLKDASEVFEDIAEHRIETWVKEMFDEEE